MRAVVRIGVIGALPPRAARKLPFRNVRHVTCCYVCFTVIAVDIIVVDIIVVITGALCSAGTHMVHE